MQTPKKRWHSAIEAKKLKRWHLGNHKGWRWGTQGAKAEEMALGPYKRKGQRDTGAKKAPRPKKLLGPKRLKGRRDGARPSRRKGPREMATKARRPKKRRLVKP